MFDNAPWLSSSLNREQMRFVHEKVGNELAAKLGIGSLRDVLLLNKAHKKNILCKQDESHNFLLGRTVQMPQGVSSWTERCSLGLACVLLPIMLHAS